MRGEKRILRKSSLSNKSDVPKGCLAIKVGAEGEEQKRFIVPVVYINHPLFFKLLKEAEEEYGFHQKGAITIPCRVDHFRYVQEIIESQPQSQSHLHHHHNQRALVGCFRA